MLSTVKLRQDFIDYFRKNDHKFMPPSKVFIDDPTLMFVNAGMNQLKDVFLGLKEQDERFTKLCNSQICVRAGGKHNDLDDVGFDSYHLTSFEMLGNWSINRFWKEETINMAFYYLVDCCGLNKNQIYATYFEGYSDDKINLPPDDETRIIWEKYLPPNRIIPGSFNDNFWMMGDFGPCGNSTEIHYDLLGRDDVSILVNKDDPTVVEIWNNVFMEYNKDETGYHKLDKHYVDTGMGLERLSMVLQNKHSVYHTDVFRSLFGYAQALTGGEFYTDTYDPAGPNFLSDVAYRIFVDHFRTSVVALYDGVEFGPNGREYVLRKIFRRLLTYTYLYLMDKNVSHIMGNQLIRPLVEYVLTYFKKKIDVGTVDDIIMKLIIEEKGFIGKIRYIDRKIYGYRKRYPDDKEQDIFDKIKTSEGIPTEILQNKNRLIFV